MGKANKRYQTIHTLLLLLLPTIIINNQVVPNYQGWLSNHQGLAITYKSA